MKIRFIIAALALTGLATPSHAEGDAAKGAKVFRLCMACHTADAATNKVGPSLKGIVGRKAATVEGYKYSEAMLAKGTEGVVWDEPTLEVYLPDPKGFVPKTKMAFNGVKKPEDVADLIAFLKTKM
ncbi:MAG: cytochrome c family protein [Pseudomonadota bacterium]|nr:cytochrome c family protein [Pseudomonadota bacterium]